MSKYMAPARKMMAPAASIKRPSLQAAAIQYKLAALD